mmetsp:Transcript_57192/g.107285  ORF Transcript_57192/g.107285 Transcript_57192/m.107285 type:complete len:284 (+) Transcript_57192:246-1097(+)
MLEVHEMLAQRQISRHRRQQLAEGTAPCWQRQLPAPAPQNILCGPQSVLTGPTFPAPWMLPATAATAGRSPGGLEANTGPPSPGGLELDLHLSWSNPVAGERPSQDCPKVFLEDSLGCPTPPLLSFSRLSQVPGQLVPCSRPHPSLPGTWPAVFSTAFGRRMYDSKRRPPSPTSHHSSAKGSWRHPEAQEHGGCEKARASGERSHSPRGTRPAPAAVAFRAGTHPRTQRNAHPLPNRRNAPWLHCSPARHPSHENFCQSRPAHPEHAADLLPVSQCQCHHHEE